MSAAVAPAKAGAEAAIASQAAVLLDELHRTIRQPWTLMEVCGGQTHSILRWGLDQLLPPPLRLIHGPGCPVCVTPAATIDQALQLASCPGVILCSFGDMLRVPGGRQDLQALDLLQARANGADVRVLTSPLQALHLARAQPKHQVVLLAVGFETTAPATALLAVQARRLGLTNLSLLLAHVRVVPAMAAIAAQPQQRVQGFLAAGHVAAVMGQGELAQLVQRHRLPVVICGFGVIELLQAMVTCVAMLEAGTPRLLNAYGRVVRPGGNPAAQALMRHVFCRADGPWRGLGTVSGGVLQLRPGYRQLDARARFGLQQPGDEARSPACIADQVLQGFARPTQCPSFGTACTPRRPLGAPMVSSEGACAAYLQYRPLR